MVANPRKKKTTKKAVANKVVNKTDTYRKILDTGDVAANAVSALVVEQLGSKLDREDLHTLCQSTSAVIKMKVNQLIDSLQKADY